MDWYQKTLARSVKQLKKIDVWGGHLGGPREGGTPKLYQGIYLFIASWYQRCSILA